MSPDIKLTILIALWFLDKAIMFAIVRWSMRREAQG